MDRSDLLEAERNSAIEDFQPGDTVRVHVRIVEGERERTQVFEGVTIRVKRKGTSSNFTVRRVTHGVGVERIFLYYSPRVERVEVVRHGRVRRARLYYLRGRTGRAARIPQRARHATRTLHTY
jgi:large subunit ribosomal protein L19